MKEPEAPSSDLWGGLAASLVALPSALAYGVTMLAPLGPSSAGQGAFAGLVGAALLGLVAPLTGGAPRLVTAPCAPAAAVMGALCAELAAAGRPPERIAAMMALTALLSAAFQTVYGLLRGGRLIKFIPYPVVTGYLSGVAVIIFVGQLPKLLGIHGGPELLNGLARPAAWSLTGLLVGSGAMAGMTLGPRLTRRLPGAVLGLGAGVAVYWLLALRAPGLRSLADNHLVVGALPGVGADALAGVAARWKGALSLTAADLSASLVPALTLSILLSMDTLKTCVVVDALTRSRHDSDRTLLGQGAANAVSALAGGMPGAGTAGATMVNLSSGGTTRLSGILSGAFSLAAMLLFSRWVAWVPLPALAGILIVVAARMFDRKSLRLLRRGSTIVDFAVSAAVIVVAVVSGLITAAGVGLGLSILLFIHDQIASDVTRRMTNGTRLFSKRRRLPEERAALERLGEKTVVCELQGSLFFGTTDQLFTELQPHLGKAAFVILDMRRVVSVDFTAIHMLKQIEGHLHDHSGRLLFARPPKALPSGRDLERYFDEVGLVKATRNVEIFPTLDDALTRAEDALLVEAGFHPSCDTGSVPLEAHDLLRGLSPEELSAVAGIARRASYKAGETVFRRKEQGDEIYLLLSGEVRIDLPLSEGAAHHVVTFGRGDFFGEVAFLDRGVRSADAVALSEVTAAVVSRTDFDRVARSHADLGTRLFARLAKTLALRLRQTDAEVRALQES